MKSTMVSAALLPLATTTVSATYGSAPTCLHDDHHRVSASAMLQTKQSASKLALDLAIDESLQGDVAADDVQESLQGDVAADDVQVLQAADDVSAAPQLATASVQAGHYCSSRIGVDQGSSKNPHSFGYSLSTCADAVAKLSNNKCQHSDGYFYFSKSYNGQCQCATDGCPSASRQQHSGYAIYQVPYGRSCKNSLSLGVKTDSEGKPSLKDCQQAVEYNKDNKDGPGTGDYLCTTGYFSFSDKDGQCKCDVTGAGTVGTTGACHNATGWKDESNFNIYLVPESANLGLRRLMNTHFDSVVGTR